jgi:hypothetical protein
LENGWFINLTSIPALPLSHWETSFFKASSFEDVTRQVADLTRNKILIGHAISNDLQVSLLSFLFLFLPLFLNRFFFLFLSALPWWLTQSFILMLSRLYCSHILGRWSEIHRPTSHFANLPRPSSRAWKN